MLNFTYSLRPKRSLIHIANIQKNVVIQLKNKTNGIKLKADRLYKRLVCGGLILGCVSGRSEQLNILNK
jgi:hypothetical protein